MLPGYITPLEVLDAGLVKRLCRSRDYLAAYPDRALPLAEAAAVANLSPYHYQRLFKRVFGESPHHFHTARRMERARQLLAQDRLPVTEICVAVGYSSLGTFSTRFRKLSGCAPREYRRETQRIFAAPALWHPRLIPSCFLSFYGVPAR